MKRFSSSVVVLSAAILCACAVSPRGALAPNSDEFVRLEGTVSRNDRLPSPQQRLDEVAIITLHTSERPVQVELAPGWFLERQGLVFDVEQTVFVTGRHVEDGDGHSKVIAREVRQGNIEVQLRDAEERPLWKK